ncbi:MAG: hypothetical protein U1E65_19265 [Myxococcota bacterium]
MFKTTIAAFALSLFAFGFAGCAGNDPTKDMFNNGEQSAVATDGAGLASCGQKIDSFMNNCNTYLGGGGSCNVGGGSISCTCGGSSFSTTCAAK